MSDEDERCDVFVLLANCMNVVMCVDWRMK